MRIELSGSLVRPDPLVIRFSHTQNFDFTKYRDQGYTHFEVICIGGGGARGGGINTGHTGTNIRNYGGAGGGGGYHRVKGLLSALPVPMAVVVGAAGAPGTTHASNPALTTDGGDGGYSSFNDTTCRASGGKGGARAQSNSDSVTTDADGGRGGIGNSVTAGGGGIGGIAGIPSSTGPGIEGESGVDGSLSENIGQGGGGGAGGVGKYFGTEGIICNAATAGGRGSYILGDTTVYGPGGLPGNDPDSGADTTVPGNGGGAKAFPVNRLPVVYGEGSSPGTVIVRLTSE